MTTSGRRARRSRSSISNQVLAFVVMAAALVALLLVAVIAWTALQDDFSATNRSQTVSLLPAPTVETGATVAAGNANTTESAAPQALLAASLPGSGSVQELSFAPKSVVAGLSAPRARWTPTALPTDTPTPGPTPVPTFVSDLSETSFLRPLGLAPTEKWIDVNVASQTLVAYEGGLPVFQSLVSTGKSQYPTVTGQFRIWLRFQSQDMNGYRLGYDYYLRNVPYVQYFYQDYALHGTFWHNNFGTPMSHGCVNLPTPAAEWLFNWSDYGTLVNVHG